MQGTYQPGPIIFRSIVFVCLVILVTGCKPITKGSATYQELHVELKQRMLALLSYQEDYGRLPDTLLDPGLRDYLWDGVQPQTITIDGVELELFYNNDAGKSDVLLRTPFFSFRSLKGRIRLVAYGDARVEIVHESNTGNQN